MAMTSQPVGLDGLVGRMIAGRYRVLAKLGAGGMGTVFRAEQVSVKRHIALKVLDPSMTVNPELLRRFQAEAEVVARLSHPNTVTLFDFGRDETGLLFIAMELVPGRGLREVIAGESLAPYRAVDIAEQIASSLADAHAHGIVHRDLKPDNVLLSERAGRRDFARVLDFGIAKLFDDGSGGPGMTRAGQILGTPQYMSPEQVNGQPVDGRTDIYALGVILYEMLTGRPPFQGETLIALLSKHVNDPPPPMAAARPGLVLPMPLERLVMACLAKSPASRPPDMVTVANELADLRSLLDPGPRRPSAMGAAVTPAPVGTPVPYATPAPAYPPAPAYTPPPQAYTPGPPAYTPGPQAYTPGPQAYTPPPAPVPTPAPARRARSRWPIALLLLLLVGGGVAGAVFALRGGGPSPSPSPSAPSGPAPQGEGAPFKSSRLGYSLQLPAGLTIQEDPNTGGALASGSYEGNLISVSVSPVAGADDVDSRAQQILQVTNGASTITDRRTRRIRDMDLVSIVYESKSAGSRFETVFYPGSMPLAVTFAALESYFDDTAALRDSLFRDRFQPPP